MTELFAIIAILFRQPMRRPITGPMFTKVEWEIILWKQSMPSYKDRGYPCGIRSDYYYEPAYKCRHLFRYTIFEMIIAAWRMKRMGIELPL
jgi:hypothetical protein